MREIAEETGLAVEVLGPLIVQRESPRHLTIVYAARVTGGTFRPSAEVSEVRFAATNDWPVGLRDDHKALVERFCHSSRSRAAVAASVRRRTVRTNWSRRARSGDA